MEILWKRAQVVKWKKSTIEQGLTNIYRTFPSLCNRAGKLRTWQHLESRRQQLLHRRISSTKHTASTVHIPLFLQHVLRLQWMSPRAQTFFRSCCQEIHWHQPPCSADPSCSLLLTSPSTSQLSTYQKLKVAGMQLCQSSMLWEKIAQTSDTWDYTKRSR